MKNIQKGFAVSTILIAVLVIGGAFLYVTQSNSKEPHLDLADKENWKEYTNNDYGFSISYPTNLEDLVFRVTKYEQTKKYFEGKEYNTVINTIYSERIKQDPKDVIPLTVSIRSQDPRLKVKEFRKSKEYNLENISGVMQFYEIKIGRGIQFSTEKINDSHYLAIDLQNFPKRETDEYVELFESIISTIKVNN